MRLWRNHAIGAALLAAIVVLASACAWRTASAPEPTQTPTRVLEPSARQVVLPKDDAAHASFNTEWWYYNGRIETPSGEEYSFHYVLFEVRLPGLQPSNIYQVAITDHQSGAYITDQRSALIPPKADGIAATANEGFSYSIADWTLGGKNGSDRLAATAAGYAFDLEMASTKPAAIHGETGWLALGPDSKTAYYSRTRMSASGRLTREGTTFPVTGEVWFDHQWGDFQPQAMAWDWYALQLDDGSDVMLFRLRDRTGARVLDFGSVIDHAGRVEALPGSAFEVSAAGSWTSPTSGATYPMGWKICIPSRGLEVTVKPVLQDAEFDATATTLNYYWEGPVTVYGSHPGHGFIEMVGYAQVRFPSPVSGSRR